jgi:hypothetical protein
MILGIGLGTGFPAGAGSFESAPEQDTTPPVVTANPAGGTYTAEQSVELSANETAMIYYTTDGSTPTEASTQYASAIAIAADTTLKFFGKDTAGNASTVQTEAYVIDIPEEPPAGFSYLQMDGTDDYLKMPSMTFTKVVADVEITRRTDFARVVWDFRSGISFAYISQQTNGTDSIGSGTVKVNNAAVTNGTAFIPNNTRCTVEHTFGAAGTDDGNIFSNNAASANSFIAGKIYDIKFYNGTTLVAHYDMTLGNVQDQSGNGNHATLFGGTFI